MPIHSYSNAYTGDRRVRRALFVAAIAFALVSPPESGQAQSTLRNKANARQATPDTPATLAQKISRAHQQAIGHTQALAKYVERNEGHFDHATIGNHSDSIGRALDDAMHFTTRLTTAITDDAAKERLQTVVKLDTRAKATYRTLVDKLRGSSITVPEIRLLATEIRHDVSAAEQELARVAIPRAATGVAENR